VGVDSLTDYYDVSQKRQNWRNVALCGVQLVEADLRDEQVQLVDLLLDVEAVFHQAGQSGVRSS
jgi:UDP-glucuronate 4-epimerase